jgi:long-chain fatty acid transport protein
MMNGSTARTIGRGGTNIAHFDNGGVIFDNPAGMVNIDGCELVDGGVNVLITDFDYADPDNPGGVNSTDGTPLPEVGYIRKSDDGMLAYGIGVFVPAGFTEKYVMNGPAPFFAGPQTYKSFGSLGKVLPAAAVALTEDLTVGGTLGLGICHAEFEGPYFLNSPPLAGTPTLIDAKGTGTALVWSVGAQYNLGCATTVGVAYQSASRFTLNGTTRVTVPLLGQSNYDSDLSIVWPESLGVGLRHELCCCRVLSADLVWFGWQRAFDDVSLQLSNASGLGFPPAINETIPLDWRDTLSLRLGYEVLLDDCRTVRLGYVHHRNPIPAATLTPFIQAFLENGVSVGYGWTACDWQIDVAYMYTWGPDQQVGTSGLAGGDFSNSEHTAQTHDISVSFIRQY